MTTQVTLLTQPDCTMCAHAKKILAKVAADHPLQVQEIDLQTPEGQELARSSGMLFTPGVFLNGQPYAQGQLSERALRRTLSHITANTSEARK